ncbi:MAG: hypothetical protein IPI77_19445 [Saprospiraceae bacterium]|nr:hypothetical protein [Saprospiraceae bacterium]
MAGVDGKPVEHIRVDYILRGLKIPSGQHTIDFKFEPKQMLTAMKIGWWLNNLVGLIFIGLIGFHFYSHFKSSSDIDANKVSRKSIKSTETLTSGLKKTRRN